MYKYSNEPKLLNLKTNPLLSALFFFLFSEVEALLAAFLDEQHMT